MQVINRIYQLTVLLLLACVIFGAYKAHGNEAVYRLRPADYPQAGGTGFAIKHNGQTYIVSNRHVCQITDGLAFTAENDGTYYAAVVEYLSPTDDLCLLRPAKELPDTVLTVANYNTLPGALIYTDGFPGLKNQVRSVGFLRALEAHDSFYVPGTFTVMGKASFQAIPGMSGSPVLDVMGKVIGVLARRSLQDAHSMLYVTGSRLRNFLDSAKVVTSVKNTIHLEALRASLKYGIPYKLIIAIAEVESSLNPYAIGKDGELGTMQLHPKWHTPELGNIEGNIDQATKYLLYLRKTLTPVYGDAYWIGYNYGPSRQLSDPRSTEYYRRVTEKLGGR